MNSDAVFSTCRTYRYALFRGWDVRKPGGMIIGLNPSKADENHNDPTIKRCIQFAQDWGFGSLIVTNLFAYCATYPQELFSAKEPIGLENDYWIKKLSFEVTTVVAAWGNDGKFLNRSCAVREKITNLKCIRVNKSGEPAHPLYLKKDSMLRSF